MAAEIHRSAERISFSSPMYGLQGRISIYDPGLRGTPQDVLNINNRIVQITPDKLAQNVHAFHEVFTKASENEVREFWKGQAYEDAMNKWKASEIQGIASRKEYFSEPSHAEYFKQLGIDANAPDAEKQVNSLYKRYINCENPKERTLSFVSSVLKTLTLPDGRFDQERFMKERAGIEFMAAMYGKEGADVAMQTISGNIEMVNDTEGFVRKTQAAVNTIAQGSIEEQHVVYLLNAERELMATPVAPKKHEPIILPKKAERKEIKVLHLTERFAQIKAKPDLNHPYAVKTVPSEPVSQNLQSYEFPEIFFDDNQLPGQHHGRGPRRETAPHAYDMQQDFIPNGYVNARYVEAEQQTNGDSGLYGLSAASIETPEQQAQLFQYLSRSILAVHKNNPKLLGEWIQHQTPSQDLLIQFEFIKKTNEQTHQIEEMRTDPNEKLFVLDGAIIDLDHYNELTINPDKTVQLWQNRMGELQKALDEDSLKDYHLRWIELLGHSVRIPKLIEKAQGK